MLSIRLLRLGAVVFFGMLPMGHAYASCPGDGLPCPDSCVISVEYVQVFTGAYRTGEPKDVITIAPGNGGETLTSNGITIRVWLRRGDGSPVWGEPRQSIVLHHDALCLCPGGSIADAATNAEGYTTFTGAIRGGGCAPNLSLFVDGFFIRTVPVSTNSQAGSASPCAVDASDLSDLALRLGNPSAYSICSDWNEDGAIDAGDLSYFASLRGRNCENPD